jgi:hypothetical protein
LEGIREIDFDKTYNSDDYKNLEGSRQEDFNKTFNSDDYKRKDKTFLDLY